MRILVTGSAGQLGRSFQRGLAGSADTLFIDLKELDLEIQPLQNKFAPF